MFGVGIPELLVIFVIGALVFGPDKLPEFGRQLGRMVKQARQFTRSARDDIRRELGPEFSDFELTDLDPRRAIKKHIIDAWDTDGADDTDDAGDERPPYSPVAGRVAEPASNELLADGEQPPYDGEAT